MLELAYYVGAFFIGLPLLLKYMHVTENMSGDHLLTFGLMAVLITLLWPIALYFYIVELRDIKDGDEPDQDHYIFHK